MAPRLQFRFRMLKSNFRNAKMLIFLTASLFLPLYAFSQEQTPKALDIGQTYRSTAPITLFSTHADSGYVNFPSVQTAIDHLVKVAKANQSEIIYVAKNSLMCSLIKDQLNDDDFPTFRLRNMSATGFKSCNYEVKSETFPNDLKPSAIVFESIGGEHSIIAGQHAIITGGNFGGCAGLTAAQILTNWIDAAIANRHIWFAPKAIYNSGCFDYRKPATHELHERKRLVGEDRSLEQCLNELEVKSDDDIKNYLNGYLQLWLVPQITEKNNTLFNKTLPNLSLTKYSFIFYKGYRPVGRFGRGSNAYHLHLGQPFN